MRRLAGVLAVVVLGACGHATPTHTITGEVVDLTGIICGGNFGGGHVLVLSGSAVVGSAQSQPNGRGPNDAASCIFAFSVPGVPERTSGYTVEVEGDTKSEIRFSLAELRAKKWNVGRVVKTKP